MESVPSLRTASSFGEHLASLAGPKNVRPGEAADAVAGVQPQWVAAPGSEEEVASLLRFAMDSKLAVIPRGGGSKLGWGNPPGNAGLVLSLARVNRVLEHAWDDLTVTVEAGCSIAELQRTLARHGQHLAVDPLWPERATVGGILSTNDSGTLRHSYGGLRDLVIGVTLALADGTLAKSGGKVVKNVAGYDLPKLVTGALGTLGVITRAVFRLHPLPANAQTLSFRFAKAEEMQQMLLKLLSAKLSLARLQVRAGSNSDVAVDIGIEGTEAGIAAQRSCILDLLRPAIPFSSEPELWRARQDLWDSSDAATVAKWSVLPASIGRLLERFARLEREKRALWRAVVQASGIGWLRLDAPVGDSLKVVRDLRAEIEDDGGSFVLLQSPALAAGMDAWGHVGDALPLMRAVKQQFDPSATLNPGRYVGGI